MRECKKCEYCDFFHNMCLIDNQKCYKDGKIIHEDCTNFRNGTWSAEGYADESGLAHATKNLNNQNKIADMRKEEVR